MKARRSFQLDLRAVPRYSAATKVTAVLGPIVKANLMPAALGDVVEIENRRPHSGVMAQVVGFNAESLLLGVFGALDDIAPGARVRLVSSQPQLRAGPQLLGCVVDAFGQVLESSPATGNSPCPPHKTELLSAIQAPPPPLKRLPITQPFVTGVRAIDGFLTLGRGQRLCVLAEPGVGKSTLLAQIAKSSAADVNVIGLVGERGREIRELIDEILSPEARRKSIVVVSTSDQAPLLRVLAAATATRLAEYFRAQRLNVLLEIDSLTRYVRALREIGLAAGEMPVRRGYPPSVFTKLPQFIERAGNDSLGSITALYTVLLSSDLDEDPMIDELKGLTDGHLVLSKRLAERGSFPAIDIPASLSRLAGKLVDAEALRDAARIRRALARLKADEELLRFGATADPELAAALNAEAAIAELLNQSNGLATDFAETFRQIRRTAELLEARSN